MTRMQIDIADVRKGDAFGGTVNSPRGEAMWDLVQDVSGSDDLGPPAYKITWTTGGSISYVVGTQVVVERPDPPKLVDLPDDELQAELDRRRVARHRAALADLLEDVESVRLKVVETVAEVGGVMYGMNMGEGRATEWRDVFTELITQIENADQELSRE